MWGINAGNKAETYVGWRGMSADGGITIFLSLILTCICALLAGLYESARTAGSSWYVQTALDSSLDSLMSKYHRDVWEKYRIFLLEFENKEGLESELDPYLETYLEEASFYPIGEKRLVLREPVRITERSGEYLEKEILEYMKLGIWNTETPENMGELAKEIREAEGVSRVAEQYQENGRKVLKLERALDQIGDCLKKQEDYLDAGNRQLRRLNGSGFIKTAGKLKRELERVPSLVDAYEKEADRLGEELARSEQKAETEKQVMKDGTWELIHEEMDSFRSYTDQDGARRMEAAGVRQLAESNKEIVEEAIRKAEEVQEYIEEWEADDDDDELDEQELWEQVLDVTDRFKRDGHFRETGIKDKKTMNVLETLSRLAGSDLLDFVVPDDKKVSKAVLDRADLPSLLPEAQGTGEINKNSVMEELAGTVLLNEYTARYFTNFLSEEEKEFQYEQEYLLNGAGADRENLKSAVNRIVAVREAMNLIYLFGDAQKRQEAEKLALSVTGAAGIAPLVAVTTFFILAVWALAESIEDVRLLLSGSKVQLMKSREEWNISLTGMVEKGKGGLWKGMEAEEKKEDRRGFDYQTWLKLFFLIQEKTEKLYRIMDMIQNNIRYDQKGFLMNQCAYSLEAEFKGKGVLIPFKKISLKAY